MLDESTSTSYVEPLGQQGLQNLSRRGPWIPASSPSPSQSLSRVAPPTPAGSRNIDACRMPSYVSALSSRTSFRKNEILDISDADKHEIRLAFELFDTRKVGRLCYRDMKVAMRALECDVKKAEVQHLMQKYSKDDNNEIGQDEFMQIMIRKYKDKDPDINIRKVFAVFDEEAKGKISHEQIKNIRKVAKELGQVFTDEQLEAMITEFDKDGDGEVTVDEFYDIMRKHGGNVQ